MRKLKLLLAACALLGAVCSANASQTPEAGKTYYLYNPTTGLFLSRGAGYGTAVWADNFGIPVTLVSNESGYRLQYLDQQDQYVSDAYWSWADGGEGRAQTYTLSEVSGGYKLINTAHGDNNLTLYIAEGANNEGFSHQIASNGKYGDNCNENWDVWQFLSSEERETILANRRAESEAAIATTLEISLGDKTLKSILEDNTKYAATDKSSAVTNAALSHNYEGWTYTKKGNGSAPAGKEGNGVEVFEGCGTFSQTVTGLTNGVYKVTLSGFYRDGSNALCSTNSGNGWKVSNAYLEANGSQTMIADWASDRSSDTEPNSPGAAKPLFDAGKYLNELFVLVTDGTLNLSIAQPGGATSSRWFLFTNLTLTYYSDEVSEEAANALIASIPTNPMLKATKDAMEDAKNTLQTSKTIPNYNALGEAIEAAKQSIAVYAPLGEKLTEAATVKANIISNSPSYTETFDANIGTITTNYNNGSIAEADIPTQISAVETEIVKLVKSQTAEGSDLTRALPNAAGISAVGDDNWKIENALAEGEAFHLDTWAGTASGMAAPMIEYWITNGKTLSTNKIYQTISGLQAGTYTITATIAVNNESKTAPGEGTALLFANSATKDITKGGTTTTHNGNTGTYSLSVNIAENEDLEIGIKTVNPNYNWVAFKDFKLIKGSIKPTSISLDKTSESLNTGDVTTIKATVDENASNKTVLWTSSNENVATVANGVISAVGAGSAIITAKCEADENVKATATITVTNATATSNWSDIASVDQGDFFIRNVGTGKFLGGANSWGTQASLIKHGIPFGLTKIADGKYTLNSYTYNSESDHFFNGTFVDKPTTDILVTKLSNGNYALSTAENSYVTAKAGTTVVDNSATSSNASLAQWQFLSADDMLKNLKDGDTDATFFLSEASISRNLRKSNGASAWAGKFSYGGRNENNCAEYYHGGDGENEGVAPQVYQTITVPNGTYTVKVQGFYRADAGSDAPSYLYANDSKKALVLREEDGPNDMNSASDAFTAGRYWNELTVTVTDNRLEMGIYSTTTKNWTIWDNFELELTSGGVFNVEPAIANGDYYLANSGKYITRRGGTDGERNEGVLANEGELLAKVTTNTAGISIISFYEKGDGADGTDGSPIKERLFLSRDQVYTDGKRHVEKAHHHHFWAIEAVSGGFKLRNIEDGRYLAVKEDNTVTVAEEGTVWIFDTQSSASELFNSAITAEGSFNPGFENGEHAPYNNVAKLSAIAQVKKLGQEGQYPSLKIAPLSTAISSDWVANSGEVNAIYDGTFNNAPVNPATGGVNGWSAAEGLRQLVKSDVEGSIVSTGMYVWGKNVMTYGETTGYTLPLKANTVYKLTYDRASWEGESSTHSNVTIKDPNGNVLGTASEKGSAGYWKSTDGTLISQTVYFVTTNAGNYTLLMCPWGNTVFTNMELKKTNDVLTFADGSVPSYLPGTYPSVKIDREFSSDKWSTAVYPFAVSADKIAVLKSYDAESGKLAFESASASTPNVPFLLKNDGAITTLSNVEVSAAVAEDAYDADSIVSLKGVYAQTSVEAEEGVTNYVLSDNKIYKVGDYAATVNPYHAYIQLAQSAGESRELTFTVDGEATGISEVKAQNNAADGNIYNLNGQRVKNAKKGVYIMNGKTVIVK